MALQTAHERPRVKRDVVRALLERELPTVALRGSELRCGGSNRRARLAVRVLDVAAWSRDGADPRMADALVADVEPGDEIVIELAGASGVDLPRAALEVATRCQRLFDRRNGESDVPELDAILAAHRALHDLSKPLVRADWDHALDVWQWVLRLAPDASFEVQVAALFHDVERLRSEPDRRIEHHARDYQRFKDAHARGGADIVRAELRRIGIAEHRVARIATLVAAHERPGDDAELRLLNDADALSFFSLNSSGFADYFGPAHTRRKVAWTLKRLDPSQRWRLDLVKLRGDVRAVLSACIEAIAEARP